MIGQCQGRGSLVIAPGPDVSHSVTPFDFAASLELELKPRCHLPGVNALRSGHARACSFAHC